MAEKIIRIDFKNRKRADEQSQDTEQEKPADEPEIPVKETWDDYLKKTGLADSPVDLLVFMTMFSTDDKARKLMGLPSSPSSLKQSQMTVRTYTTSELKKWLEKSTENDWRQRAGFYKALYMELKHRLDTANI